MEGERGVNRGADFSNDSGFMGRPHHSNGSICIWSGRVPDKLSILGLRIKPNPALVLEGLLLRKAVRSTKKNSHTFDVES